jgi:hypothetical protein
MSLNNFLLDARVISDRGLAVQDITGRFGPNGGAERKGAGCA